MSCPECGTKHKSPTVASNCLNHRRLLANYMMLLGEAADKEQKAEIDKEYQDMKDYCTRKGWPFLVR